MGVHNKTETLEEFLARGGKITYGETKKAYGVDNVFKRVGTGERRSMKAINSEISKKTKAENKKPISAENTELPSGSKNI